MRSSRRGAWAVALLVTAATAGSACGGTSSSNGSSGASTPTSSPVATGADVSEASDAPEVSVIAETPTAEELTAQWDDRLALAAEFDRTLVTALADAAGITEQLGDDAAATLAAVLASSTAAVHEEWRARGIDPAAAEAALSGPPPPVSRWQGDAGSAGVLALITSMMSAFEPVFAKSPDPATGHITDRVNVQGTIPASKGPLTITLDQTADVDLNMCPDATGLAEGVVTIDADMMATGTVDGEAVSLRASAAYSITTTVNSDAEAGLASTDGSLTGTIVSSGSDGDVAYADSDGVGVSIPYGEDGEPVSDDSTGHGSTSGTAASIDDLSKTFLKVAVLLAIVHGQSALSHWSKGRCVRLETEEPLAPLVGEATDIDVSAVHKIDGADVTGSITVTPRTGTFDPLDADVPATIHVVPEEGAPYAEADVEMRSLRGIGRTEVYVPARGYHVELGDTVTISGDKCDGFTGLWPLVFAGTVSEQGISIVFDGTLDITVNADQSASYELDLRGTAEGFPMLTASLTFQGGGAAVFVDDDAGPRIDLLDGELATIAEGSGPGVSINGIVTQGPAGHASIPVTPSACATPGE
jgi:hypothetical protein